MSDTTKDGQPGRPLPKGEAKATKTLIAIQKLIATQRLALNDVAVSDLSAGILDSFRTQAVSAPIFLFYRCTNRSN